MGSYDNRIKGNKGFFRIGEKYNKVKSFLIESLEYFVEITKGRNIEQKLRLLFYFVNTSLNFDISLIQLLKIMVANFIQENENIEINEVDMKMIITSDGMSLDDYIDYVLEIGK